MEKNYGVFVENNMASLLACLPPESCRQGGERIEDEGNRQIVVGFIVIDDFIRS